MAVETLDAVTLDFHNTLFQCDDWFTLEVETLVPRLLGWLEERRVVTTSDEQRAELRRTYRSLRRQIIADGIERDAASCVLHACRASGLELDPRQVDDGIAALMRDALATASPMPGAVEAVRDLRVSGLRVGVISNAIYHPFLLWALDRHGMGDAFDVVTTSASAGYYKSHPGIYQQTLAELNVAPRRTLHVGDSLQFDVLGAARAGLRTAYVTGGDESAESAGADIVIRSLHQLVAAVHDLDAREASVSTEGSRAD